MSVGLFGDFASARGAANETFFDEEGFVDFFHCAGVFANGGGDGAHSHRTSLEFVDDGEQNLVVDFVKTIFVDVEGFESIARYGDIDAAVAFDLGKIAHTAQEGIGNTGCSSRTSCNLSSGFGINHYPHEMCGALDDVFER